jgi:hypothetical protein
MNSNSTGSLKIHTRLKITLTFILVFNLLVILDYVVDTEFVNYLKRSWDLLDITKNDYELCYPFIIRYLIRYKLCKLYCGYNIFFKTALEQRVVITLYPVVRFKGGEV